jgi:hypothetical protein
MTLQPDLEKIQDLQCENETGLPKTLVQLMGFHREFIVFTLM